MPARKRIKNLYELVMDFLKKCSDDHDIPADLNQIHSFFKR